MDYCVDKYPTELGYLKTGDLFMFKGEKYRSGYSTGSNSVWCLNLENHKNRLLDIDSDVYKIREINND